MATATKKSSTTKRSQSGKSGSTSTTAKASDTLAKKEAAAIHQKREDYDNPPVDTPVDLTANVGETEAVDSDDKLVVVGQGSTITVSIGSKSVTLDREGALSLQRHLDNAGVGL